MVSKIPEYPIGVTVQTTDLYHLVTLEEGLPRDLRFIFELMDVHKRFIIDLHHLSPVDQMNAQGTIWAALRRSYVRVIYIGIDKEHVHQGWYRTHEHMFADSLEEAIACYKPRENL